MPDNNQQPKHSAPANGDQSRPPKKRRNRRRKPGGADRSSPAAPMNAQQASPAATKPAGRNKRRRRKPGSGAPRANEEGQQKTTKLERIIIKYENLRAQHLEARRKYFDLFDRADPQQKDKLERVFTNTAMKMQEFEDSLTGEDKELFDKHYNGLKEDRIYSENHELDPQGEPVEQIKEFEDPHYLVSQKNAKFSDDTEESVGSLEDYMSYKGISPQS